MPLTQIELPILSHFLCVVESTTGKPPMSSSDQVARAAAATTTTTTADEQTPSPPLPKGVVLGPDGKPCRSCTSASNWRAMMSRVSSSSSSTSPSPSNPSSSSSSSSTTTPLIPSDCPADVEALGRSTWTLLHTLTAQYPERASATQQSETRQFLGLFGRLYPCWACAEDFRAWMATAGNEPRVGGRGEFGRWMCEAHNAVNVKLGKERFDCGRWEERWRTGWGDGRCG